MHDIATIEQLLQRVPAQNHADLEAYLRWLRHSLNNPLGTTVLELYSARRAVEAVREANARRDDAAVAAQLQALGEIFDNLEEACTQARAIVSATRLGEAAEPALAASRTESP